MSRLDAVNDRLTGLDASGNPIKVSPFVATVDGALSAGQVLGEWVKIKPLFDASNATIPTNAKVFGADGSVYQLTGASSANEPSTDSTNWTKQDLGAGAVADGVVNAGSVVGNELRLTTDKGQTVVVDVAALITQLNNAAMANPTDDTKALTAAGLVSILQAGSADIGAMIDTSTSAGVLASATQNPPNLTEYVTNLNSAESQGWEVIMLETANPVLFIDFGVGNEKVVGGYSIYQNDQITPEYPPNVSPIDWHLYGSNRDRTSGNIESEQWILLDSQTAQNIVINAPDSEYAFANQTAYRHYKWEVTKRGDFNGEYLASMIINRFRLYEPAPLPPLTAQSLMNAVQGAAQNVTYTEVTV